jgi:hypothetical protein
MSEDFRTRRTLPTFVAHQSSTGVRELNMKFPPPPLPIVTDNKAELLPQPLSIFGVFIHENAMIIKLHQCVFERNFPKRHAMMSQYCIGSGALSAAEKPEATKAKATRILLIREK